MTYWKTVACFWLVGLCYIAISGAAFVWIVHHAKHAEWDKNDPAVSLVIVFGTLLWPLMFVVFATLTFSNAGAAFARWTLRRRSKLPRAVARERDRHDTT